ncbi:hypothetical protein VP01_2739g2 [Puccinia sorghi]|uniref:Uncharacterized protein n=1 Tax=Puccinia sorghi TaxID=27349 RepID=A0A0L6V351_9BASI|nr:hypothetical protein VP01_2739g2 [Puccinia sorghi]
MKNSNQINVKLIPLEEMVADSLTKPSNANSLKRLQQRCFLVLFSPRSVSTLLHKSSQNLISLISNPENLILKTVHLILPLSEPTSRSIPSRFNLPLPLQLFCFRSPLCFKLHCSALSCSQIGFNWNSALTHDQLVCCALTKLVIFSGMLLCSHLPLVIFLSLSCLICLIVFLLSVLPGQPCCRTPRQSSFNQNRLGWQCQSRQRHNFKRSTHLWNLLR